MRLDPTPTYPSYPDTPFFDVATRPLPHILAFRDLLEAGMQPVLCTRTKTPMWRGWPDYFPTLDDIVHHDHLVGHVPARLGLLVFDVDRGTKMDIDNFCERYPPLLRVPSLQPGRAHLYYRYSHAYRIRPDIFQGHGLKGDIRSHHSYAILWSNAVVELRTPH